MPDSQQAAGEDQPKQPVAGVDGEELGGAALIKRLGKERDSDEPQASDEAYDHSRTDGGGS